MIRKLIPAFTLSILILSACTPIPSETVQSVLSETVQDETPAKVVSIVAEPISRASARVIKKPFGIKISQNDSPVSPERFAGYHTGADFEILPGEEESEVDIFAICTGPVLQKRMVEGYGGFLLQKCTINDEKVTVLYGHLKLSSIAGNLQDTMIQGQKMAILGQGYSKETDGERKHLHLGIHKGEIISILGYVQSEDFSSEWIDPMILIK